MFLKVLIIQKINLEKKNQYLFSNLIFVIESWLFGSWDENEKQKKTFK